MRRLNTLGGGFAQCSIDGAVERISHPVVAAMCSSFICGSDDRRAIMPSADWAPVAFEDPSSGIAEASEGKLIKIGANIISC